MVSPSEAQEFYRNAAEALVSVMNEPRMDPVAARAAKDAWEILAKNFLNVRTNEAAAGPQLQGFVLAMENAIALLQTPRPIEGVRQLQSITRAAVTRLESGTRS